TCLAPGRWETSQAARPAFGSARLKRQSHRRVCGSSMTACSSSALIRVRTCMGQLSPWVASWYLPCFHPCFQRLLMLLDAAALPHADMYKLLIGSIAP